jgi:hypothetical protein
MRFVSTARHTLVRSALFLVVAALESACVHLDPPMRASAEQAREREAESPPSNPIRVRSTGSSTEPCTVNFDDPAALSRISGQARLTFAAPTGRSPSGDLELCDTRVHSDCWTWRERCTRDDVNVEPINYPHIHLPMERGVDCYGLPDPGDGDGPGFGRIEDGTCVPVDWADTPRILASHDQIRWTRIWVGNAASQTPTYFDMESIWVLPDKAVQLWFRKRDGTWWFWPELEAGGIWDIGDWVRDVAEVRIRGAESGLGPYIIGAFVIRD